MYICIYIFSIYIYTQSHARVHTVHRNRYLHSTYYSVYTMCKTMTHPLDAIKTKKKERGERKRKMKEKEKRGRGKKRQK